MRVSTSISGRAVGRTFWGRYFARRVAFQSETGALSHMGDRWCVLRVEVSSRVYGPWLRQSAGRAALGGAAKVAEVVLLVGWSLRARVLNRGRRTKLVTTARSAERRTFGDRFSFLRRFSRTPPNDARR